MYYIHFLITIEPLTEEEVASMLRLFSPTN